MSNSRENSRDVPRALTAAVGLTKAVAAGSLFGEAAGATLDFIASPNLPSAVVAVSTAIIGGYAFRTGYTGIRRAVEESMRGNE